MTNTVGFRPKLLPPQGRQLQRSYRPLVTCLTVSGCIAVLVCVVFGLTAFNIYSHRFGRMEHLYHAGDEISLRRASSDLSATFCSAYRVEPMGWTDFYLLPHEAELDPTKTVHTTFTLTAVPRRYVESVHYLPANSTVSLSACYDSSTSDPASRPQASFLVIRGDGHYREWRKHFNFHHVRYTVPIPENATCSDPSSVRTLAFEVPKSDNYYFILLSPDSSPTPYLNADRTSQASFVPHVDNSTLTLSGSLNKTQFDLTGALAVCNASESVCRFPLQWGDRPDVVAKIHQDIPDPDARASFVTRCHERLEFWIPVFGALPLVIMVLMWVWCWWLLVKRQDLRSRYRLPPSRQESRTDYGSMGEETDPLVAAESQAQQVPEGEERCASIQG